MNYDVVSHRQKYGKTYVTNYVLPHILSRLPFPAEGTCFWRRQRGRAVGVLDLQSRSEARRLSRTLNGFILGCPVSKSCPSHLKCIGSETSQTLESCISSGKFSLHLHFKLRSCCRYPRVQSLVILAFKGSLKTVCSTLNSSGGKCCCTVNE